MYFYVLSIMALASIATVYISRHWTVTAVATVSVSRSVVPVCVCRSRVVLSQQKLYFLIVIKEDVILKCSGVF